MTQLDPAIDTLPTPERSRMRLWLLTTMWIILIHAASEIVGLAVLLVTLKLHLIPPESLEGNGPLLSVALLLAFPLQCAMVFFASRRLAGSATTALGLDGLPRAFSMFAWVAAMIGLIHAMDWVTRMLGAPDVPRYQVEAYQSAQAAGAVLPLWLAFTVCGPVTEELLFRGLAFDGYQRSAGTFWAAALPLLIWTGMHVQYDLIGMTVVLAAGLAMTLARIQTGSLLAPLVMHMTMNMFAVAQTAAVAGR